MFQFRKKASEKQLLVVSRWKKPYRTITIFQEVVKINGQFAIWSVAHKKELGSRKDKPEILEQTLVKLGYREATL